VPLAALAKQEEELFTPGKIRSVRLPERSEALYLVQRVRDEAHRFANQGHRNRRSKVGTASILDAIPGVGPTRRKILLDHFGTLDDLRKATVEEIAAVPGIPVSVGQAVKSHLA
jgi:excinuclease ABC subunit C